MSTLRQKLLDVFEIEYREHLETIRRMLGEADGAGLARADFNLTEATRRAHSLKGAARAVGLEQVETLAHRLESLFIDVQKGETALDRDARQFVLDALDEIEDGVVASRDASAPAPPPDPAGEAAPAVAGDADEPPAEPVRSVASSRAAASQMSSVRVNAENLDRLLKSAGELHADMLYQTRSSQEIGRLSREVTELSGQWDRIWRQIEAGTRGRKSAPARTVDAGHHLTGKIKDLSKRLRAAAQRQDRCARSLHHHLDDLERRVKAARMMPAESVFASFRKMVRDVAASEGKQVEVTIDGLDCEADRLVLQRIKDPVMHMLRNAVSHGIETPDERTAQGKAPRGHVTLGVANQHDRLSIVIEDDGRGIDFRRIADKAVETGRLSRQEADAASEDALCQILFEPGFSTADSVTRISGRGLGLSVARETVNSLQGIFNIASKPGAGTRIEISLPVSVISRRLLLVSFRDQLYALPSEFVVRVMRVPMDRMVSIEGRPAVQLKDSTLPLVSIGELLGSGDPLVAAGEEGICVVVVRNAGAPVGVATHVGVAVDGFVGVNDFVVRHIETGGRDRRLWSGIVSTDDGTPCLVLNVASMIGRGLGASRVVFRAAVHEADQTKVVLVVDDSITTRTLEKGILEAHGYEVRLSVDGRDALAQLRASRPDIVISDVEMPHVDGFELLRAMKNDRTLSDIPVILVTSRADNDDRERGLRLGADAYVVKQRFDQNDLLQTIRQMI